MSQEADKPLSSLNHDPSIEQDYAPFVDGGDEGAQRAVASRLSVLTQRLLVRGNTKQFHDSAIYQQIFVPHRVGDAACMTMQPETAALPLSSTLISLNIQSEKTDSAQCGKRATETLTLLLPAFQAGVNAHLRANAYRSNLSALFDSLNDGARLVSARGQVLYQNAALTQWLSEPEGSFLSESVNAIARNMAATAGIASTRSATIAVPSKLSATVRTSRRRYTVVATQWRSTCPREVGAILVLASALASGHSAAKELTLPAPTAIQRRYRLTPRETQVALLIARGQTNRDIAINLHIAETTARHHTESVLAKLGVDSRHRVLGALRNS